MMIQNENLSRFEGIKSESSKGEVGVVIENWAKALTPTPGDEARQFLNKANVFNEEKMDRLDPATDINFWLKYGVRYWENLDGEVLGKTGMTLSRDRIKVSSELAKEAAEKVKGGEEIKNLSKAEQVSMLVLTKAKLLAAEKTATNVYSELRSEFEASKREVDKELTKLLVDKDRVTDVAGNLDWDKVIPAGKLAIPTVITVGSILLAACGNGSETKPTDANQTGTTPVTETSSAPAETATSTEVMAEQGKEYLKETVEYGGYKFDFSIATADAFQTKILESYGINVITLNEKRPDRNECVGKILAFELLKAYNFQNDSTVTLEEYLINPSSYEASLIVQTQPGKSPELVKMSIDDVKQLRLEFTSGKEGELYYSFSGLISGSVGYGYTDGKLTLYIGAKNEQLDQIGSITFPDRELNMPYALGYHEVTMGLEALLSLMPYSVMRVVDRKDIYDLDPKGKMDLLKEISLLIDPGVASNQDTVEGWIELIRRSIFVAS